MRRPWCFQESFRNWTLWSFGWMYQGGRGWDYDFLTISFGPLNWVFLREYA